MAASSNRNESYIIEDILMTLATWHSSFLYQTLMDRYDVCPKPPHQIARTTYCTFSLHNPQFLIHSIMWYYYNIVHRLCFGIRKSITSCTVTIHSTTKPHHYNHGRPQSP
eukprot:1075211_1